MSRRLALTPTAVLVLALCLSSCSAGGSGAADSSITGACLAAVEAAERETIDDDGGPEAARLATVRDCESLEDWVAAVEGHPIALGYANAHSLNTALDLGALCFDVDDAAVCEDAREQGLID